MKPALTPEEWRLTLLWAKGKLPGGKVRGMCVLDLPPEHQHGAAALALHAQPFGFSRLDVATLLNALSCLRGALCGFPEDEPAERDRIALISLAARIEALLPPEAP